MLSAWEDIVEGLEYEGIRSKFLNLGLYVQPDSIVIMGMGRIYLGTNITIVKPTYLTSSSL